MTRIQLICKRAILSFISRKDSGEYNHRNNVNDYVDGYVTGVGWRISHSEVKEIVNLLWEQCLFEYKQKEGKQ
jgi:hypothetical protein